MTDQSPDAIVEDSTVEVSVEDELDPALEAGVEAAARQALRALDLSAVELSVLLCDDDTIRQLNADWRGKNEATDVLSFAQDDGEAVALPPGMPRFLGDLAISVDTATRQAAEQGHDLSVELRVLLVHGLLHLLGHDHLEEEQARSMRAEEARVLAALGGATGLVERADPAPHP